MNMKDFVVCYGESKFVFRTLQNKDLLFVATAVTKIFPGGLFFRKQRKLLCNFDIISYVSYVILVQFHVIYVILCIYTLLLQISKFSWIMSF